MVEPDCHVGVGGLAEGPTAFGRGGVERADVAGVAHGHPPRVLPAPFHGSDKVLGYGLALAALWYFGGLLWRLKKGTAGVKPVEDLVQDPPQAG